MPNFSVFLPCCSRAFTKLTIRYLAVVELNSEQLVFVFGPCPAAAHEMEMVRTSGLLQLLPPNGKVVADGGFRGEAAIVHPFRAAELNDPARVAHNERIKRIRWKIEAVFSRLKSFAILSSVYKHNFSKHRQIFLAVVAAYNIDVVYHPLQV